MSILLNATHAPALKSWVESANDGHTDFAIQNLPHGVFRRAGSSESFRGGVAIGAQILDVGAAAAGVFDQALRDVLAAAAAPALNGLMAMGRPAWTALRAELSRVEAEDRLFGEGGLDLAIDVQIATARSGGEAMRVSLSNTRHASWSLAQMLVHHTENGCAMAPGDLIGSGTSSGPTDGEKGWLMELASGGRQAITLANGETRTMLEDGDTVILRAWAKRPGAVRIGLGECRGTVLPARPG